MDKDYTTFIHLTDSEGRLWAQDDRLLQDHGHFTSSWNPATVVKQPLQVHLPPDFPPGEYAFSAGVYHWETGQRLPVRDLDTGTATDDAIPLGSITVVD
jgi:hypothetical protein